MIYTNRSSSCKEEVELGLSLSTMTWVRSKSPGPIAGPAAHRCLLMWPPRAWPVAKPSPHVPHACATTRFGFAVGRRRWLVRWPPSAWNVANCRPHVVQANACPRRRRRRRVRGGVLPAASPEDAEEEEEEPQDRERKTSWWKLGAAAGWPLLWPSRSSSMKRRSS